MSFRERARTTGNRAYVISSMINPFLLFLLKVENLKKVIKASSQSDLDSGTLSGMPAAYHSHNINRKLQLQLKPKGQFYYSANWDIRAHCWVLTFYLRPLYISASLFEGGYTLSFFKGC